MNNFIKNNSLLTSTRLTPSNSFATMTTQRASLIYGRARSTTGRIRVEWWDGTSTIYGSGNPNQDLSWSKTAGFTGLKTIKIYPCDSSGDTSGSLTRLYCYSIGLLSLNVVGLSSLQILDCSMNNLQNLDLSGLSGLETLLCFDNNISSINLGNLNQLIEINCANNSLTSLSINNLNNLTTINCGLNELSSLTLNNLSQLSVLYCYSNSLSSLNLVGLNSLNEVLCENNSLTSLSVSGLTELFLLGCSNNLLNFLDVSNLTSLLALNCNNNLLTSLRAVGVPGAAYYNATTLTNTSPYFYGIMAVNNSLNAQALDQLYSDVADNTSQGYYSVINVDNNPGTDSDDPSIATAKNWIVLGS